VKKMKALSLLARSAAVFLPCLSFVTAVEKPKFPNSITLSYEVIGSAPSSVKPLATVFYDPRSLRYSLESWTPPSLDSLTSTSPEPSSASLLRILLPNGSSTVTSISNFDEGLKQTIDLWISDAQDGSIFSASVTSRTPPPLSAEDERLRKKIERAKARGKPIPTAPKPKPKKKPKKGDTVTIKEEDSQDEQVKVNLLPATAGPTAKLGSRKPPQVDADGNEVVEAEVQEKSFFQKYWWIFLVLAVLTLGGGGGGDK
jgi:hypothetical protein